MSRRHLSILFLLIVIIASGKSATAQLFGPRNVGRNTHGQQPNAFDAAGTVSGDRRFVRGARAAGDFVGTDRGEAAGFVGNTLARNDGQVPASVTGLREQPTVRVNRPRGRTTSGLYPERLSVAFRVRDAEAAAVTPETSAALERIRAAGSATEIRITRNPTERSAVLTGSVPTEHDRRIAELLVMFEPGLETVTNDLQLAPHRESPHRDSLRPVPEQ